MQYDGPFYNFLVTVDSATVNAATLGPFDCCAGDIRSVGLRRGKWKQAFNIYLKALNIENSSKKRATLLHIGSVGLQKIYHNIPGAHVEQSSDLDIYDTAIIKLDGYFFPKQSKVYERHMFRSIKQDQGKKFGKFLLRLRNQAEKCRFKNLEENIIDQIPYQVKTPLEEMIDCCDLFLMFAIDFLCIPSPVKRMTLFENRKRRSRQ